ncbi:hypothetical protein BBP40_003784 [Aspergillus hancockii]|nr:hypothetical protein BBP40_003784 [Aspergillus hancockii]
MASSKNDKKLFHEEYSVGWVSVLQWETDAVRALLDEEHKPLVCDEKDTNSYLSVKWGHNIIVVFPPTYGTNAAAHTVTNMLRTFHNIRFGLSVGLGDVVVSQPGGSNGEIITFYPKESDYQYLLSLTIDGVLQCDMGNLPRSDHTSEVGHMNEYIHKVTSMKQRAFKAYRFPGRGTGRLFRASYRHVGGSDCSGCDPQMLENRRNRDTNAPEIHYGLIASGNAVMRSAQLRDKLRDRWNISCFEMEVAGLMDSFPCLVFRGICDYSNDNKNKLWQNYTAATAAAFAKDLLLKIQPHQVQAVPPVANTQAGW